MSDHHKNPSISTKLQNLYLDAEIADVYFVFDNQQQPPERVPAHKNILAIGSDVFKAMFYGEMKETGDVLIVDASVDAFKEFLSFFYSDEGKLTEENVSEVLNLGKKYNVHNCLTKCESFLMSRFHLGDVCSYYGLAILYNLRKLKSNCEQRIAAYTRDTLESTGFVGCSRTVLSHILKLDRISCSETEVFHACMAWVKAATKQDQITKEMIRTQLGDLFYEIRFGAMTMEEFAALLPSYADLFHSSDYKHIVPMIVSKVYQSEVFKRQPRQIKFSYDCFIKCYRANDNPDSSMLHNLQKIESCTFSTNQPVLLRGFTVSELDTRCKDGVKVHIVIVQEPDNEESQIISEVDDSFPSAYTFTWLRYPVLIKPGIKYTIRLHQTSEWHDHKYKGRSLKTKVNIETGLIVQFHDDELGGDGKTPKGFIIGLQFYPVPKDFPC